MVQPGEENDIIAYAFNASRDAFTALQAPREYQRQAVNRCRGAILGLKKINVGKPTARDISLIEKIMMDNEAGKISDRAAATSLKKIAQKYGLPTFEHDMVLRNIEMQDGLNKKGRGVNFSVPPVLLSGLKSQRKPALGIKPLIIKPVYVKPSAVVINQPKLRGRKQSLKRVDPFSLIFGPPRRIRKKGRL